MMGALERRLRDRALKGKLRSIFALSGVGLGLALLVMLAVVEWAFLRQGTVSDYETLAEIMADNTSAELQFGNARSASEKLAALMQTKGLSFAEVLSVDGESFAVAGEGGRRSIALPETPVSSTSISYLRSVIEVIAPIESRGEGVIGYVYIQGSFRDVYARLALKSLVVVVVMALGGIIAFPLASRLGQLITRPILDLSETARRISETRDFSKRQPRQFGDETGVLVDSFNAMMDQIEARDAIIRSNEERFREYFELGVVGMAVVGEGQRFLEVNDELACLFGCSQETLKRSRFDDWVRDERLDGVAWGFQRLAEGCSPGYSGEHWFAGAGDALVFTLVSARRLKPHANEEPRYVVLVQDITERKRSEEELLRSKQTAEAANRAKDEFLSVMSHELRTPLNPIIGFVDLLMRLDEDPERLGMLQAIRKSSEHLLALITDILEFSRSQAGRLDLAVEALDLVEICGNVVEMMRPVGAERRVDVSLRSVDLGGLPMDCRVVSDPGKIRQLLLNLISNAIKYNRRDGFVWIDLRVTPTEDENCVVRFDIEDTGVGIAPDMQQYIFEPFTQLDMSLQRKHEGVGLGLAICRRIVQRMGGQVLVQSEAGRGAVFTIEFPAHYRSIPQSRPAASGQGIAPLSAAGRRVLLVEDDLYNKNLVAAILRRTGIDFEWAENGQAAVEAVQRDHFDMILMDIRMPLMDGLEATRRIRAFERDDDRVPIVAMTAHTSESMQSECYRAGMDGYLSKPVEFDDLQSYLRRYLERA